MNKYSSATIGIIGIVNSLIKRFPIRIKITELEQIKSELNAIERFNQSEQSKIQKTLR